MVRVRIDTRVVYEFELPVWAVAAVGMELPAAARMQPVEEYGAVVPLFTTREKAAEYVYRAAVSDHEPRELQHDQLAWLLDEIDDVGLRFVGFDVGHDGKGTEGFYVPFHNVRAALLIDHLGA